MRTCALAIVAVVALTVTAVNAADKAPAKKPIGSWKHTVGDNTVTFHFTPEIARTVVEAGGNTIEVEADYGISKDGVVFGRIFKVKKGGDEGPSEGDLFSFKVAVDKNTLTLSDVKTANDSPEVKQLLQGEYQREKSSNAAKDKK